MPITNNPDLDYFNEFLETFCIRDEEFMSSRLEIYLEYIEFMFEKREQHLNIFAFIDKMKINGIHYENLIFYGIKLKDTNS